MTAKLLGCCCRNGLSSCKSTHSSSKKNDDSKKMDSSSVFPGDKFCIASMATIFCCFTDNPRCALTFRDAISRCVSWAPTIKCQRSESMTIPRSPLVSGAILLLDHDPRRLVQCIHRDFDITLQLRRQPHQWYAIFQNHRRQPLPRYSLPPQLVALTVAYRRDHLQLVAGKPLAQP